MKKNYLFLILIPFLMAFQCESDLPAPYDNLNSLGLLGTWEIQNEIINGNLSDIIPRCCEFIEFYADDDITDNKGLYFQNDSQGTVSNGTFEVDLSNLTIVFIDDNNVEFVVAFTMDDTQQDLTLEFTEDDTNYTQGWAKIN